MAYEASPRAREIAETSIIVDGHQDVPYRLHGKWEEISEATAHGSFDCPRAVAGGLDAPFMAIYTPADLEKILGENLLGVWGAVEAVATARAP